jgi:trigger factor
MNITKESTGELSATIKIELGQNDYQDHVNNSLKELQRKSTLKGFRPGKVPYGMIKKMYEKSVVAEEVNKLLSDTLNNYITENKLEILGYPLANVEKNKSIDFENSTDFDFFFDIGLTPSFTLDISENRSMEYYDITVEDTVVDNYLEETRRRFGKFIESEIVVDGDFLQGLIHEVDENGLTKGDGIKNNTTISLNHIKDEKIRQDFIDKKVGDKIVFNPLKATGNIIETNAMLGIDKEQTEKADADFEFVIEKISRIELAAIDKELFEKVYAGAGIEDEKQFRDKLALEAKSYYQAESENYFVHTTMEKLINETQFDLPDEFIKRWLVDSDAKLTSESVEKDYDSYIKSLKHQLIINKIMSEHGINVTDQEMKNHIKDIFVKRYMFNTMDEDKSKQLDSIVESVLKNKEEATKIYDQLFDDKVRELFKSKYKLDKKEVSYTEFINIVNEHHKIHHHVHEE